MKSRNLHFLIGILVTLLLGIKLTSVSRRPTRDEPLPKNCKNMFAATYKSGAGLGNWMIEYVNLMGFCERYGCRPFLSEQVYKKIRKIFPDFSLPLQGEARKCGADFKYTVYDPLIRDLEEQPEMVKNQSYTIIDLIRKSVDFADSYEKRRNDFIMSPSVVREAWNVLEKVKKKYQSNTAICFHVRRGDYVPFIEGKTGGVYPGTSYYKRALEYYKTRYPDAVFLVMSDDQQYCRDTFQQFQNAYSIEFPGTGVRGDPGLDFAIFTQCSHTLITAGSFGFWATYKSEGNIIYPVNYTLTDKEDPIVNLIKKLRNPRFIPISAAGD